VRCRTPQDKGRRARGSSSHPRCIPCNEAGGGRSTGWIFWLKLNPNTHLEHLHPKLRLAGRQERQLIAFRDRYFAILSEFTVEFTVPHLDVRSASRVGQICGANSLQQQLQPNYYKCYANIPRLEYNSSRLLGLLYLCCQHQNNYKSRLDIQPLPWVMVHHVGPWWIKVLMGLMGFPLVPQLWEIPLGIPPLQGASASVPGSPALPN
jgi:hypothetical protein